MRLGVQTSFLALDQPLHSLPVSADSPPHRRPLWCHHPTASKAGRELDMPISLYKFIYCIRESFIDITSEEFALDGPSATSLSRRWTRRSRSCGHGWFSCRALALSSNSSKASSPAAAPTSPLTPHPNRRAGQESLYIWPVVGHQVGRSQSGLILTALRASQIE